MQLLAEERARRDVEQQLRTLDASLAAATAAWGGKEGLNAFRDFRERLVALLEGGAEAPAADGEWDGRCRFVMRTK